MGIRDEISTPQSDDRPVSWPLKNSSIWSCQCSSTFYPVGSPGSTWQFCSRRAAGEVAVAYLAVLYREQPVQQKNLRSSATLSRTRPLTGAISSRLLVGLGKKAMHLLFSEIWPKTKRLTVEVLVANTTAVAFWRHRAPTLSYRFLEDPILRVGHRFHADGYYRDLIHPASTVSLSAWIPFTSNWPSC